ncbi:toprim domain-containing protein [Novosphingobium aerophilum]|uniref:Toprim domain-containing protein n=1 Tax=Novosphingobium aerophilum TaxID=2839843 RepID=A0A7X1F6M4_9SPHN|nr:toprim domain-containing protein [Novosphingobium aerophilum]MBC2651361.1 toprim domain-containing protein [Novosphingobium aerophilum]
MTNPVLEFIDAMGAAGIRPLEPITDKLAAGEPVRFRADGDKPGRRNGWAWLHLDGVPAGVFRHYRLGVRAVWRAGSNSRSLSPAERRAIVAQARESEARRRAETEAKQEAAAGIARDLWRRGRKADPAHGYLTRKGLPPFGIRQHGEALIVPMVDCDFRLWNVQRVYPNGRKLFLSGGRTDGLFWLHGAFMQDGRPSAGPLVIGEGFATMAAVHHATGHGVVAAMSARNLETVARALRKLFPSRTLIVASDDDRHLSENIGLKAAQRAAESTGALLATPLPLVPETRFTASGADSADIAPAEVAARIARARRSGHA